MDTIRTQTGHTKTAPPQAHGGKRDQRADVLKAIGLYCIILAHSAPPGFIFQMRDFDVPLMVMVSGALLCGSSAGEISYREYLIKRIQRLAVPTWTFLVFFFSTALVVFSVSHKAFPFTVKEVLTSFGFISGIGYVWIIRVFILVAMVSPFLLRFRNSLVKRDFRYFAVIIAAYLCYEALYLSGLRPHIYILDKALAFAVFYVIPYGFVCAIGLALPGMSRKSVLCLAALFFTVFAAALAYEYYATGEVHSLSSFKYPPRLYYLSYAMLVSLLLYSAAERVTLNGGYISRFITFASSASLWIYLWHIFFLFYFRILSAKFAFLPSDFLSLSFGLFLLSSLTAWLQRKLVVTALRGMKPGKVSGVLSLAFLK